MSFKKFFLLLLLTSMNLYSFSQRIQYFKNFSIHGMHGIDSLPDINSWPDFFVKCSYDYSGKLIGIDASSKLSFNHLHDSHHISVIDQNKKTILIVGAGKQRDGYTRGILQKQIYETDSAFVTNDTLLYKRTSEKFIRVQLFTKINRDSISFSQIIYPFASNKNKRASKFSSFNFYKEWFTIDSGASQINTGIIKLKSDTILVREKIKSDFFDTLLNITKRDFDDRRGMPVTLFWLKDSGLLN